MGRFINKKGSLSLIVPWQDAVGVSTLFSESISARYWLSDLGVSMVLFQVYPSCF